ncbi:UreD-domain-containing protein [Terfezia boudieri ATCC MYA-4762]|uniref:UreD-domain-containing protein n=1 Tax=Terfezia boudieri ATCC MYA-4762 TaxID=1051890 RepID=A0A3N4M4G4_9PEZI|nr:UreD-domain-containing protein [Terfezia boudieri ATCC MYA-4762]
MWIAATETLRLVPPPSPSTPATTHVRPVSCILYILDIHPVSCILYILYIHPVLRSCICICTRPRPRCAKPAQPTDFIRPPCAMQIRVVPVCSSSLLSFPPSTTESHNGVSSAPIAAVHEPRLQPIWTMTTSVFPPSSRTPGHGLIHAACLPPRSFTLSSFGFVYPLKLISSSEPTDKCLTIFILSYGGGLVSNDKISLKVVLEENVKLCLLTQGSTKVFKLRPGDVLTTQAMTVGLAPHSALLLLPDPVQPFGASVYSQTQTFNLPKDNTASLIVLDWVSEGRTARGEKWELKKFSSRNDVFQEGHEDLPNGKRLLLRDSLILQGEGLESLNSRMDSLSCVSTLIIRGPRFTNLASYILERFELEPRIGNGGKGWNWDKNSQDEGSKSQFRNILWTAASVRGFVLVKVSAKELEEARRFLRDLLLQGRSAVDTQDPVPDIVREFGVGSLRCLE